jgi:GDPmannose 4,6-dehydratase
VNPKTAFVTGITGQDGSYLAEYLLRERDYSQVVALIRRRSTRDESHLRGLKYDPRVRFFEGELEDSGLLAHLFASVHIQECYNLAAQSFVAFSFGHPVETLTANTLGNVHLLDAIRHHSPETRFYQASTSEMYGGFRDEPMSEKHDFHPRSPYGTSKLAAYWNTVNMREAFGLFACNGILFNHESPRRGSDFVTQKIVEGAVAHRRWLEGRRKGDSPVLRLGNLEAKRDWGDARDFVRGMWRILQQETPDDFVLATGVARSVREFVEIAFAHPRIEISIGWEGEKESEVGKDSQGRVVVAIDPQFYRPTEVNVLLGDASKARNTLGWKPEIPFDRTVHDMVEAAWERAIG